ncbi:MAG TPA: DUF4097 family beta strand repeat-containing protein [Mycobacteriales bacterium]|nr:DUF4097 family beta strand repeat-containing protein [Mycobacteriales bacterium]
MTKLRAVVVAGGVAGVVASAAPANAIGPVHHQTQRAVVVGNVTALVIRGEVGNITVVPGPVTRITAREQYNLEAPRLAHSLDDGVLRVSAPCPRPTGIIELGLNDCAVDLLITVHRAVTVDASNSVGDIRARGLRGAETLRTDVGDIVIDDVRAPHLRAVSDTGDISMSVAAGTYAVDVHSDVGDTRVRGISVASDAPRTLSARTDTGDIRITGR